MVQIEKRKKKGRPSKADLAARRAAEEADASVSPSASSAPPETAEQREIRRSLRRKTFRYNIIDYDEDYLDDDVVSEEEQEEVDEEDDGVGNGERRKRGKKVKLVLKLNNNTNNRNNSNNNNNDTNNSNGRASGGSVSRRGRVPSHDSEEEEEEEEEDEEREVKKRRINGGDDEDENEEDEDDDDDDDEGGDGKEEGIQGDYVISGVADGKCSSYNGNTPLPDIKQLQFILEKLQKKDTYGVYSEPVDPEELPDYHDVIEHPMDFSTVRKKLANGSYSILEDFESDVFLISSNAMQYNAPETVYHKQARAIKELAEKKFERLRMQIERLEKEPKCEPKCEPKLEPKSEQKERSYSLVKKQTKKLFSRETICSDFSTGATLATMDAPNNCSTDHVGSFERPINNDGLVEGISFLADNNLEKAEDPHSGKGVLPKFGRKSFVVDENRRATYNISNQLEDRSDSIFTTFEGDKKQLIPVGLSGEFSYARSLARYAANLGPMAWKTASKRIEQVLPPGLKHGRGWIGEYEPLPTAVLVVEHRKDPFASRLHDAVGSIKDDRKDSIVSRSSGAVDFRKDDRTDSIVSRSPGAVDFRKDDRTDSIVSRSPGAVDFRKDDKFFQGRVQANEHLRNQPSLDGKLATMFGSGGAKSPASTFSAAQQQNPFSRGSEHVMLKGAESNCPSTNIQQNNSVFQQQCLFPRDSVCPENMGAKRVEPNSPSISDQKRDYIPQKQLPHGMEVGRKRMETISVSISDQKTDHVPQKQRPHCMEMPFSMQSESLPNGKNFLQSLPIKQPDANGGAPNGSSNGKAVNNILANNRVITPSPGLMSPQPAGAAVSFSQKQEQGLSDPVLVMKMLTEKAQRQQNGSIHAHSPGQARPFVSSPRVDTGGNAAAAAASAWMSVGPVGFRPATQNSPSNRSQNSADSLYNATRMFYPQAMQPHVEYPISNTRHFPPEKTGFPFQSFASQPTKVGNEGQVPSRPMVFPQLATNDLSRFQMQAPWRDLSPHTQQKQKQDTLPPDLNVAFQSSVDSQQPDLALQL